MADPLTRDATHSAIPDLMAYLDATCEDAGVDEDAAFMLRLATEEVLVNVITHGYAESSGPVRLAVVVDEAACRVTVEDEAPVFDPANAVKPDLEASVEDRAIGGLGWHLVYRVMDEVHHEALPGGGNRVTLVKRLSDSS